MFGMVVMERSQNKNVAEQRQTRLSLDLAGSGSVYLLSGEFSVINQAYNP
jgi:hypothetical protein